MVHRLPFYIACVFLVAAHSVLGQSCKEQFSSPTPVPNSPYFYASFAPTSAGHFVVGNTSLDPWFHGHPWYTSRSDRYRTDTTFVGQTPEGTSLPSPLSEGIVAYPQIFVDAQDVPHLFWVEPNPDSLKTRRQKKRPRGSPLFYTVMHSKLSGEDSQGSWTSPDTVFYGKGRDYVYWSDQIPPGLASTSGGTPLISFHSVDFEANDLFVQTASEWENRSPPIPGATTYTDLAVSEGDRIHFAYIAPHLTEDTKGHPNSVFVRWSDDNGVSWSDSTLIYPSDGRMASNINVLVDTPNTVHLLWTQSSDPGNTEEAISYTYSTDRGRTWSEIHRASIAGVHSLYTLKAELSPCGNPIAIFSASHASGKAQQKNLSLFTTKFTRTGAASPPRLLFDEGHAHTFSVDRDDAGAVHVMWTRRSRAEYGATAVTLHSVLTKK